MAEGTYEYECSRAELLGNAPPNYEDWQAADKVKREQQQAEEATELDAQEEKITETHGRMDGINNILSITQLRLNKFKKACGSLTNLLKIRGGVDDEGATDGVHQTEGNDSQIAAVDGATLSTNLVEAKKASTDVQQKMSCQIDKLDSLLTKAENAQMSMAHQNKQMKSFLK